MTVAVSVQHVPARKLAAVTRRAFVADIPRVFRPALDLVWAFLRDNPGLRDQGHNVFLYRHPESMADPMRIDFGVEVTRGFAASGDVHETDTPSGEAAVALHVGPYIGLPQTHAAIHAWAKESGRRFAGWSMEIYGDWTEDSSKLETTVVYFLA